MGTAGDSPEHFLSPSVRRLAGDVLHNVSELEIALLARARPDRSWTATEVSDTLRVGHAQAQEALGRLRDIGVVAMVRPGAYRYAPSDEVAEPLDALAELYRSHRQAIERLVFSRSKGPVSYFPPEIRNGRARSGSDQSDTL